MTATPTDWTDERCAEAEKLERLIGLCRSFNQCHGCLARLAEIEQMASKLSSTDFTKDARSSFMSFLRELAIKDRFPEAKP